MDKKCGAVASTYLSSTLADLEAELYRLGRRAEASELNYIRAKDLYPFKAAKERWPDLFSKIAGS